MSQSQSKAIVFEIADSGGHLYVSDILAKVSARLSGEVRGDIVSSIVTQCFKEDSEDFREEAGFGHLSILECLEEDDFLEVLDKLLVDLDYDSESARREIAADFVPELKKTVSRSAQTFARTKVLCAEVVIVRDRNKTVIGFGILN